MSDDKFVRADQVAGVDTNVKEPLLDKPLD